MGSRRLVVSIDFGTTYSGLAWAESSRADVQHVIDKWPARNSNQSSPKVPTELRAIANGHQWGFQIPASSKRSKYFKLKLDESSRSGGNEQSPEELARIYLSHLYRHLMSTLKEQLSTGVLTSTPIEFVITVPAIWSDAAIKRTETAAEQAGFRGSRKIRLVTEPEAAAIYTLRNLGSQTLGVGKTFVVCDAGGGTVDLISYTIEQVSPSLKRFRRYLKQRLGDAYWTVDRLAEATQKFEEFKKTYTPNSESLLIDVALADNAAKNIRRGRFRIPQADMSNKVFEPIVKDVIDLVEEQVRLAHGNVAAVLMVGGFGANEYLRARIDAAVGSNIRVMQPANGWTAVVRGAAIMGLQSAGVVLDSGIDVSARIARKHYGTELIREFKEGRDDISKRFWYAKWGCYAVSYMRWFVNKGELYPVNRPSVIPMEIAFPVWGGEVPPREVKIYANSVDARAPMYRNKNTSEVAQVTIDVNRVSLKRLIIKSKKKQMEDGHWYFTFDSSIIARYESAGITYTLQLQEKFHDVVTTRYN